MRLRPAEKVSEGTEAPRGKKSTIRRPTVNAVGLLFLERGERASKGVRCSRASRTQRRWRWAAMDLVPRVALKASPALGFGSKSLRDLGPFARAASGCLAKFPLPSDGRGSG